MIEQADMMLLDTSAWVEFFIESEKGLVVKDILKTKTCYTSIVSIAEMSNWALKYKKDKKLLIKYIIETSDVCGLTKEISELAGELNFERKQTIENWGMLDSFILATALMYNLTIVTKDTHFKNVEKAVLL